MNSEILTALQAECDKGYYGPRYVSAEDVRFRSRRSISMVSKHLRALADEGLAVATADSGRKGGYKITDKGREALASEQKGGGS